MMKRTILALISLLPLASFAQAYTGANDSGIGTSVVGILLGIGICVVIFMVLRQVFFWYWKVEVIIKQDEQIQLLKGIYNSIEENNRLTQSQIELTIGKEEN